MTQIKYILEFYSDWHIGSGNGIPGIIDNGVLRDKDEAPLITGKSVKGILRDSIIDLLELLESNDEEKIKIISEIFGWGGDYLKLDTVEHKRAGKAVFHNPKIIFADNTSGDEEYIRHGNRIDIETGTAQKGALFSTEMNSSTHLYNGIISFPDENFIYSNYIIAGLRFTTKIGGRRRRGAGRCEFYISKPRNWRDDFSLSGLNTDV